jgi:hypothetical protein
MPVAVDNTPRDSGSGPPSNQPISIDITNSKNIARMVSWPAIATRAARRARRVSHIRKTNTTVARISSGRTNRGAILGLLRPTHNPVHKQPARGSVVRSEHRTNGARASPPGRPNNFSIAPKLCTIGRFRSLQSPVIGSCGTLQSPADLAHCRINTGACTMGNQEKQEAATPLSPS